MNNLIGVSGGIGCGKDLIGQMLQYIGDEISEISFYRFEDSIKPHKYRVSRAHKYEIKKFADKLKDCVCLILGCTREQLEDRDYKETELGEEWWGYNVLGGSSAIFYPYLEYKRTFNENHLVKLTPRLVLQLLGTEGGRQIIHPNIWVNALFADYKGKSIMSADSFDQTVYEGKPPNWIITDLRFPKNEGVGITKRNGLTIGVRRLFRLRFPEYEDLIDCTMDGHYVIPEELKSIDPELYKTLTHESETSMGDHSWCDVIIENDGTVEELFNEVLNAVKHKKELV